ncbi:MAG: hypothetical protein JNM75_08530 [Rhodospirillales bacterium]|nr:hypothetical protein [Rhodospirillales bacterium]
MSLAFAGFVGAAPAAAEATDTESEVEFSAVPPADIAGGAPNADLSAAAQFAWRHFVALHWPAAPQTGLPGTRGEPDPGRPFGDPAYVGPLVWETLRSKSEVLPGIGQPHGREAGSGRDYGYDDPPQYVFDPASVGRYATLPVGHVPACEAGQDAPSAPPWVDLSEAFEAGPEKVFAGHLPQNGDPGQRRVLYTVKVNRPQYAYIAQNQWYGGGDPDSTIPARQTAAYIALHSRAPPAGTADYVSFPPGAVEVKAAWRLLTEAERSSGRFHIAQVRTYEWQQPGRVYAGSPGDPLHPCFVDQVMGLIGLHLKVKTPSAPYYIWATFEQADNVRDAAGDPIEDADGRISGRIDGPASDPPVVSKNARAASPETPDAIQKLLPAKADSQPARRLYYTNPPGSPTPQGLISVNRRYHAIPDPVIEANAWAHRALRRYAEAHNADTSPWASYKLVSVQWRPADKPVPGKDVVGDSGSGDEVLRYPAIYYMANIVIETSHRLQVWSGQIQRPLPAPNAATPVNNLITDFEPDGQPTKNVQFDANRPDGRLPGYNMGGCMGCHGQMQRTGYDFSFILRRGRVDTPEVDEPLRASLHEMLTKPGAGQNHRK